MLDATAVASFDAAKYAMIDGLTGEVFLFMKRPLCRAIRVSTVPPSAIWLQAGTVGLVPISVRVLLFPCVGSR